MPLPFVPQDSTVERQHRTVLATTINELIRACYPREGTWTAVIRGSGTAGTYEIASQTNRYTRIGRRVWIDFSIVMAGVVTGGGTGDLAITGVPFAKAANTVPVGAVITVGLNFINTGAFLSLSFPTSGVSSTLYLRESLDNASGIEFPISGIGASDIIQGSISYETDDP